MGSFDPTPVVVATISAAGGIIASLYAYQASRKTKARVDSLPSDLVKGFTKLQPGVDTVEKVVELLYGEIERLNRLGQTREAAYEKKVADLQLKVDTLISEKQDLLDEIGKMKRTIDDQKTRLEKMETRIKNSIDKK